MGIETKYDYTYYTVLNQAWFDEAERILNTELTSERLVNAINNKLQDSKDVSLNKFKVDYSQRKTQGSSCIRSDRKQSTYC